ncbi:MAG: GNAT family N-acetyltransferase [Acidimicrobiales bacterium]
MASMRRMHPTGNASWDGDLVFSVADPGAPPASELLAENEAELDALYGGEGVPLAHSELSLPSGAYLVGRLDGRAVAGGGVRRLDDEAAEIKRMYVVPGQRRRGIGSALLLALEHEAQGLGYRVVRLDTGPQQPHAEHLYRRSGYTEIPDYNGNARASFWAEKRLGPP